MSTAVGLPIILVTSEGDLARAVGVIGAAPALGVDIEGSSRHHYGDRVSLVQAATPGAVYILDPVAVPDLTPIGPALADARVQKVVHGGDYDLRGLHRDWGLVCANVYDTGIAARFCGLERFGLAALLQDVLGLAIPKDERIQRGDWLRRPLSQAALTYAAQDVAHLVALRDALDQRLAPLGRTAWVAEECERLAQVRHVPDDPQWAFLRVKGSQSLDARGLAVLRAVYAARDAAARLADMPPAFVVPDVTLIALTADPPPDLASTLGVGAMRRWGAAVRDALIEGARAGPLTRPRAPRGNGWWTPGEERRLRRYKAWRNDLGRSFADASGTGSLDPSLLWPQRSLQRIARDPATLEEETRGAPAGASDVREWQRREFADSLRAVVAVTG